MEVKQTLLAVGSSNQSFLCACGCGVFTEHSDPLRYVCRVCKTEFVVRSLRRDYGKENYQSELLRI